MCFNCRQAGHDLASCPQVASDVDHGAGVCFKCGSTEHKINQCKLKLSHGLLLCYYVFVIMLVLVHFAQFGLCIKFLLIKAQFTS